MFVHKTRYHIRLVCEEADDDDDEFQEVKNEEEKSLNAKSKSS